MASVGNMPSTYSDYDDYPTASIKTWYTKDIKIERIDTMADAFTLRPETDNLSKRLVSLLRTQKYAMVTVGTGGGKTYIATHAVGLLDPNTHVIIFAPKKKIIEKDWDKSIDSYNEVMGTNILYDTFNYEKLIRPNTYKEVEAIVKQYMAKDCTFRRNVILILDEAHRIKDPTSKTSKGVQKLTKLEPCKRIIGLTATPISNSYLDAVGYFVLAGFYRSKNQFIQAHVKFTDQYNQPIVKDSSGRIDRNLFIEPDLLDRLLASIIINVDLEHLKPPLHTYERHFTFDKETQAMYRQIKKDYQLGLYDSIQEATQAMREFVAIHGKEKNHELTRILNNPVITRPVLIFYSFNAELEVLRTYLNEQHQDFDIIEVNGKAKITEEDLLEPKNPRTIFLIQYMAGSEGLDAKWSNVSIFYAPTNRYGLFKQAIGRNVRAHQKTGDVYQFQFIYDKTIDSQTWRILEHKADFSNDLMRLFLATSEDELTDDVIADIASGKIQAPPAKTMTISAFENIMKQSEAHVSVDIAEKQASYRQAQQPQAPHVAPPFNPQYGNVTNWRNVPTGTSKLNFDAYYAFLQEADKPKHTLDDVHMK